MPTTQACPHHYFLNSVGPVEAYISGLFKKTQFVFNYVLRTQVPDKNTDIAEFWVNPELPVYLRRFYCPNEKTQQHVFYCVLKNYAPR